MVHLGDPHAATKPSTTEIRAARRQLADRIRVDWSYPAPSSNSKPSLENGRTTSLDQSYTALIDALPEVPCNDYTIDGARVLDWRERTTTTSDLSSDEQDDEWAVTSVKERMRKAAFATASSPAQSPQSSVDLGRAGSLGTKLKMRSKEKLRSVGKRLSLTDVTSVLSPEAIAEAAKVEEGLVERAKEAELRMHARKRKRDCELQEEMAWNDGLAHWVKRRDAWCCARVARLEDETRSPRKNSSEDDLDAFQTMSDPPPIRIIGADAAHTTEPAKDDGPTREDLAFDRAISRLDPNRTSTSSTNTATSSSQFSTSTDATDPLSIPTSLDSTSTQQTTTLIPLVAPILPTTDPTRAAVRPAMYPSIYSKVVVQSLTPSVPVNLSHMVGSLVDGWKRDGEWPSSASTVSASRVEVAQAGSGKRSERKERREREREREKSGVMRRRHVLGAGKRQVSTGGAFATAVENGVSMPRVNGERGTQAPMAVESRMVGSRDSPAVKVPPQPSMSSILSAQRTRAPSKHQQRLNAALEMSISPAATGKDDDITPNAALEGRLQAQAQSLESNSLDVNSTQPFDPSSPPQVSTPISVQTLPPPTPFPNADPPSFIPNPTSTTLKPTDHKHNHIHDDEEDDETSQRRPSSSALPAPATTSNPP